MNPPEGLEPSGGFYVNTEAFLCFPRILMQIVTFMHSQRPNKTVLSKPGKI